MKPMVIILLLLLVQVSIFRANSKWHFNTLVLKLRVIDKHFLALVHFKIDRNVLRINLEVCIDYIPISIDIDWRIETNYIAIVLAWRIDR